MIGLLIALYPASWRRRYAEEFRSVLESRPLGPFDVADVLISALDARISARRFADAPLREGGHQAMLRIGGFGAVTGATSWMVGFIGANVLHEPVVLWLLLLMTGTAGILLALVGLSAFQAHRQPRLAWAAFAIPGLGSLASLVGLYGMAVTTDTDRPIIGALGSWEVWALGAAATLLGCALFAAATVQASVLSRPGAIGLAVSSVATLGLVLGGVDTATPGAPQALMLVSLLAFAGSWSALGISALRRGPIRAITVEPV